MTTSILYQLKLLDNPKAKAFVFEKTQIIIGSDPACDLQLNDASPYHAFICHKGEQGMQVKALCSDRGILVNGKRTELAYLFSGDKLSIGQNHFVLEEVLPGIPMTNPGIALPHAMNEVTNSKPKSGLTFIDGEYCDIIFDETNYRPLNAIPQIHFTAEYTELDEQEIPLELSHCVKSRRLEVITYINGLMTDLKYIELKNGHYFLSPENNSSFELPFMTLQKTKLFSITKGKLNFYPLKSIVPSLPWEELNFKNTIFLTNGSEQISLRLLEKSVSWRSVPLLFRDRDFLKLSGKIFAALFVPMLLLFFVDIPKPVAEKPDLIVIYKINKPVEIPKPVRDVEKSELTSTEATSVAENTGHKEQDQKPDRPQRREAPKPKLVIAKSPTPKVQAKPAPAPVVASVPTPAPVAVEVKAPRPYSFKSSAAKSMLADSPKISAGKASAGGVIANNTFSAGSADQGGLIASATIGNSNLAGGLDSKGTGAASYGSRGLANKKGFDSAYLEQSTVIQGSMDPELLRKILREYIPQFRHCYQQELMKQSEKTKGIMELNFTITAQGKASRHDIRMKDAKFSQAGIKCVSQVLNVIDFPKPKGGGIVDVRQPLNFMAETKKQ